MSEARRVSLGSTVSPQMTLCCFYFKRPEPFVQIRVQRLGQLMDQHEADMHIIIIYYFFIIYFIIPTRYNYWHT